VFDDPFKKYCEGKTIVQVKPSEVDPAYQTQEK